MGSYIYILFPSETVSLSFCFNLNLKSVIPIFSIKRLLKISGDGEKRQYPRLLKKKKKTVIGKQNGLH